MCVCVCACICVVTPPALFLGKSDLYLQFSANAIFHLVRYVWSAMAPEEGQSSVGLSPSLLLLLRFLVDLVTNISSCPKVLAGPK